MGGLPALAELRRCRRCLSTSWSPRQSEGSRAACGAEGLETGSCRVLSRLPLPAQTPAANTQCWQRALQLSRARIARSCWRPFRVVVGFVLSFPSVRARIRDVARGVEALRNFHAPELLELLHLSQEPDKISGHRLLVLVLLLQSLTKKKQFVRMPPTYLRQPSIVI